MTSGGRTRLIQVSLLALVSLFTGLSETCCPFGFGVTLNAGLLSLVVMTCVLIVANSMLTLANHRVAVNF